MLKRKENEPFWVYCSRLYRNKIELGMTNKDIYETIKKETNTDKAESSIRCNANLWNECADYMTEKLLNEKDDKALKELEDKRKEIEILKVQFQDQKREYRNYLRIDARWKHIIDEMKIEINKLNTYRPIEYKVNKYKSKNIATLMLGDWHIGMQNDTSHNVYNLDIAKYRLEKLYSKVIQLIDLHNIDKLNIELQGDFVHGIIHLTTRINAEEDVISQTILVSEMLSDFVGKLANNVNNIDIHGTTGNHSRVSANIKENIDVENFERLITWYMKTRLVNCKNVNIYDDYEEDIILYKAFNMNIACVHGHKEKYKTAISDLSRFLRIPIDELHLGHFHSHNVTIDNDMETIVNGCLCGADEYAQNIRKSNCPSQTMVIYTEEGQECVYNIKLR